jgi:hypothetical protein
VDRDTRKRLYNLCDPKEPLAPDDPRNVDVDALPGAPRGQRWVDVLAGPMELSGRPSFTLVTAQRGAGLTTELRRLAARLGDKEGANLLVVYIDGEEVLDLHSTLDVPDILLAVVEQVEAAVSRAEGKPESGGVPQRLRRWLVDAKVDPAAASVNLRSNEAARKRFHSTTGAELSRFVDEVRSEVILLEGRARRTGHAGLAGLLDSVSRLRGNTSTWKEVLASAERVFGMYASYLELSAHVLYTVPSPLVLRVQKPVRFLPQIALFDRAGKRAPGFEAAREIVRRRVPRRRARRSAGHHNPGGAHGSAPRMVAGQPAGGRPGRRAGARDRDIKEAVVRVLHGWGTCRARAASSTVPSPLMTRACGSIANGSHAIPNG